jgi:hypothetical protein
MKCISLAPGRRAFGPTHRTFSAMAGAAAAIGLLAVPGLAAAAPYPAGHLAPASSASLCAGVSAAAVSSAVGYTLPAAVVMSSSGKWGNSATILNEATTCTYGVPNPMATTGQGVVLAYDKLSSPPPKADVVADLKAALAKAQKDMPPGGNVTWKLSTQYGIPLLYLKTSFSEQSISISVQFEFGWKGTKVAGVYTLSNMPKSNLAALEKLAIDNDGI